MKGLLLKDWGLMKNQGRTLAVLLVAMAVFLGVTLMSPGFLVGYVSICLSIFAASSISYDEYDNGYLYLFTLPVTRKDYVNEKYLFGLAAAFCSWSVGIVCGFIVLMLKGADSVYSEWLTECPIYLGIAVIFVSVMIPLRLRFEGEKGRVVLPVLIAGIGVLVFGVGKGADLLDIDLEAAVNGLIRETGTAGIAAAGIGAVLLIVVISWALSRRIMEKKEF